MLPAVSPVIVRFPGRFYKGKAKEVLKIESMSDRKLQMKGKKIVLKSNYTRIEIDFLFNFYTQYYTIILAT